MKKMLIIAVIILSLMGLAASQLFAQLKALYGDDRQSRIGVHAGNQFRTSFFNDGTFGGRVSSKTHPLEVAGEWPINSGHYYVVDGNPMVGSEVQDASGALTHIVSENKSVNISQTRGDRDPVTNEWWTFLPLPGFANADNDRIAMARGSAEWSGSWPPFWPDIADPNNARYSADGWAGSWNGYFGRDVFNADEESYFVADDYKNKEFLFYPDSTNIDRRGLGIRMYVRGFQWAKAAVEDGIFCLYDLENIGTYTHDKMVFGFKVGNNMGESTQGADAGDDDAAYNRDLDLAYMWDHDDLGAGSWSPVGYMGGAFLESPGNPYDGIDNDNDGRNGSGGNITEALFQEKALNLNDQVIFINYSDPQFPRRQTTLADTLSKLGKTAQDTLIVKLGGRSFKFWAGKNLQEIGDNLFDDNLNGLIDENRGRVDEAGVLHYLYIGDDGTGYKYVDYITGNGVDNKLIDERRDDGIDNDGDWDALTDDTGADGVAPGSPKYPGPDIGERNGYPDPGEPHFDKTDIDETDMLGLTSFFLYDWNTTFQYDDEQMWNGLAPGLFSYTFATANVELLYGSGYFPLVPGQTERFSMALACGTDLDDLVRNKGYFAQAYNQNYNFAKAPYIPTVKAAAGDNKVTLFWNDFAESSVDPIGDAANNHRDFEGYRIYRSTDPGFNDAAPITDSYGSVTFRTPIAQFDLDNDYSGLAAVTTQGVRFYLGNNTGLRHFWVDTTAVNGYEYFYAVTSYDHGDPTLGIDPSECTKFVAVQASGEIEKGTNVVVVRPAAPAAGYIRGDFKDSQILSGANNTAEGAVQFSIFDPDSIRDNHTYQIFFNEALSANNLDSTESFNLIDLTANETVLANCPLDGGLEGLPIVHGFQLSFSGNPDELNVNADNSGWNKAGIPAYTFRRYVPVPATQPIKLVAGDFEVIFSDVGIDTSKRYFRGTEELPPIPVNFTIMNTITNKKVDFAFRERHANAGEAGKFSFNLRNRRSDEIIFLTNMDSLVAGWQVVFNITSPTQADSITPGPGDVLTLKLDKPFLSHDSFQFTTVASAIDPDLAKADMDKIRVVPNPYIATNSWEPQNPYASGRGERQLHFIHLPSKCTIKIFNVRGQLVKTIEHEASITDGTEIWDMLSRDNLEISYGIYLYHIDAGDLGEKIGKFVIVK